MICPVCGKDMVPSSVNPTTAECPQCGTYIVLKLPKSARSVISETQSAPVSNGVYLCHVPGRGEPKHVHKDIASAVAEAERICILNKQPVRVYQQIAVVNPVVKTEVKYG